MLEKIRESSQGPTAKIILGLVILSFALAGVGGYLSSSRETAMAVVNGEDITASRFEQAFSSERERRKQQFGDMYDLLAADPGYMQGFRAEVLEQLIDDTLQKQLARKLGIRVSDEQVRDTIRNMSEFQIDGIFNNDRYIALLRQAGYQPSQFRELIREDLASNQLLVGLLGSEFGLGSEVQLRNRLVQQTRDISYALLPASQFADAVNISDAQLHDYYLTNLQRFMTQQKVAVEYVELSSAMLASDIDISQQQIAAYYEANKARYTTAEQRQVAHIMLESEGADAAVAAKAEQLLAELNAGADFATLAKTHSADVFSAENGGVLDYLVAGQMDPKFESAAFALQQQGELSGVVQSEYGYHLIKLVQLTPAQQQPLADVSADIAVRLQQEEATEQFYQLQQRLAQLAFEVGDTLEDAASAIEQRVKTTPLFSRNEATEPLAHPAVMAQLFDSRFIADGLNSDVIEIGREHVVVMRVINTEAARTLTMEEVRDELVADLSQTQQTELAKARAVELLAEAKELTVLAAGAGLTLETSAATPRFGGTLQTEIRAKAFALPRPAADASSLDYVVLAHGDVALVAVSAVKDAEVLTIPEPAQLEGLARQRAEQSYMTLIAALKAQADISRNLTSAPQTEDF
ncbi:SurA N-terminal domain-containing protein [Arsukibacterium sp.]|uniref:SurA N-terminal domain-containing protein n=1 Tax=Arsukibacterium sp. TaxID=1977258 RepID=UPI002FDA234A